MIVVSKRLEYGKPIWFNMGNYLGVRAYIISFKPKRGFAKNNSMIFSKLPWYYYNDLKLFYLIGKESPDYIYCHIGDSLMIDLK